MGKVWVSTSVLRDLVLAQGKGPPGHLLDGRSVGFNKCPEGPPLWLKGGSGRLKQKTLQVTCYMESLTPSLLFGVACFLLSLSSCLSSSISFSFLSLSLPSSLPPSLSLSLSLCLCSTSDLGSLFSWDNSGPSGHLLLTNAVRLHSTMGLKTFTLLQLCNPSGLLLKAKLFHITSALQSLFLEPPLSQSGVLQDTCWNPHFPHPKSDLSRDVFQALQGTGGNQKDSKWVIFFILLFLPQDRDCFDVSKNQLAALGILNHEYLNVFLLVVVLLLFFLPVACSSLFLLVFFVIPLVDDDLSSFSFLLPFL